MSRNEPVLLLHRISIALLLDKLRKQGGASFKSLQPGSSGGSLRSCIQGRDVQMKHYSTKMEMVGREAQSRARSLVI